jgi:hypothetical protein
MIIIDIRQDMENGFDYQFFPYSFLDVQGMFKREKDGSMAGSGSVRAWHGNGW